jgi:transposase
MMQFCLARVQAGRLSWQEVIRMEAYWMDLRERVLAACDGGKKAQEVAQGFAVRPAWVGRLKQRRREAGQIGRLPQHPGRKPKLSSADRQRLAELVADQPDATRAKARSHWKFHFDLQAVPG